MHFFGVNFCELCSRGLHLSLCSRADATWTKARRSAAHTNLLLREAFHRYLGCLTTISLAEIYCEKRETVPLVAPVAADLELSILGGVFAMFIGDIVLVQLDHSFRRPGWDCHAHNRNDQAFVKFNF